MKIKRYDNLDSIPQKQKEKCKNRTCLKWKRKFLIGEKRTDKVAIVTLNFFQRILWTILKCLHINYFRNVFDSKIVRIISPDNLIEKKIEKQTVLLNEPTVDRSVDSLDRTTTLQTVNSLKVNPQNHDLHATLQPKPLLDQDPFGLETLKNDPKANHPGSNQVTPTKNPLKVNRQNHDLYATSQPKPLIDEESTGPETLKNDPKANSPGSDHATPANAPPVASIDDETEQYKTKIDKQQLMRITLQFCPRFVSDELTFDQLERLDKSFDLYKLDRAKQEEGEIYDTNTVGLKACEFEHLSHLQNQQQVHYLVEDLSHVQIQQLVRYLVMTGKVFGFKPERLVTLVILEDPKGSIKNVTTREVLLRIDRQRIWIKPEHIEQLKKLTGQLGKPFFASYQKQFQEMIEDLSVWVGPEIYSWNSPYINYDTELILQKLQALGYIKGYKKNNLVYEIHLNDDLGGSY